MRLAPTATKPQNSDRSVIVNSCPGCGAPVMLEHEYDITSCTQCGSCLRVANPPDLPAYFLRPKIEMREAIALIERSLRARGLLGKESIAEPERWLIPFWEFQGQLLKKRTTRELIVPVTDESGYERDQFSGGQTSERIVAQVTLTPTRASLLALPGSTPFPDRLTLGQTVVPKYPLVQLSAGSDWPTAEPRGKIADAMQCVETLIETHGSLFEGGREQNPTQLFVSRTSILFVPFYRWRDDNSGESTIVVDATTGELQVSAEAISRVATSDEGPVKYVSELLLIPHRCPHCSQDLPATYSVIYRCSNCERFVYGENLEGKVTLLLPSVSVTDTMHWFPFWSHESHADLVAPAFAIRNLEIAVRLARQVATVISRGTRSSSIETATDIIPASVRRDDSVPFLSAAAARIAIGGSLHRSSVASCGNESIQEGVKNSQLVLVPFVRGGYEYTDAVVESICFAAHALDSAQ